ncbi:MAG: lipid-A-disaccharide kinase, partial [Gammaproteobacteria bacterium]|nr:lipid-A-disaccharide kinase [Gammaproteobacteria bacterium]
MRQIIARLWYGHNKLVYLLLPFSWLYRLIIALRRYGYKKDIFKSFTASVPVIVVGNITVGGTGKTPLVVALAHFLKQQGYKPGIVSRGYGGQAESYPKFVNANSNPLQVGDEPLLIAKNTHCPVVVDPKRVRAVQTLLYRFACDIVISNDGLQHYALARTIEIAVIDGARRFGNAHCLPAGPLREPITRLRTIDFIVCNGKTQADEYVMNLAAKRFMNVAKPNQ